MSWSIGIIENTITFTGHASAEQIRDYLEAEGHLCTCPKKTKDKFGLEFDQDTMEHMDYLWHDEIQKILSEAKANGRVCFGSLEGDNAGEFWGYEFTDGKMTELTGKVVYEPKKIARGGR